MEPAFSMLGKIGGLLCCVGDILFDLKGAGEREARHFGASSCGLAMIGLVDVIHLVWGGKGMSVLYSVLKPIVRKAVKGSSLHREGEREIIADLNRFF